MIENSKLNKKKWLKPEINVLNINRTSGGGVDSPPESTFNASAPVS